MSFQVASALPPISSGSTAPSAVIGIAKSSSTAANELRTTPVSTDENACDDADRLADSRGGGRRPGPPCWSPASPAPASGFLRDSLERIRAAIDGAIAAGEIRMTRAAWLAIRNNTAKKGDVLAVARLAGIQAAKRTADLIPLCHPLALTHVDVHLALVARPTMVRVEATAATVAQTGVEMEALTAATVALLTVYDMVKSADKRMRIGAVRLVEKSGGRSGLFKAR